MLRVLIKNRQHVRANVIRVGETIFLKLKENFRNQNHRNKE